MNPEARERWARVQEVFLEALELTRPDRTAFLDERCADDPELADEVRSLLAAHDEGPIPDAPSERRWAGRHPERVGDYRIVRPLGEGGMGVVLLAVREAEGFTQTVALKLLSTPFPPADLERRLRAERRILARLEHPGIARLIDGGITESGQPFFAMEYVKGEDLVTWCDTQRLDVDARVRLMIEVCEAVHHAHQQLVVHRDLKPSNIQVGADGRPRLLDFGVAKLLDDETASGVTRTAPWVTPAYASPEQLRGEPAGTLADVYALGVVLFELLTGLRPYRLDRTPLPEMERILTRGTRRRASQAATDSGGPEGTDAAAGRPDPTVRAAARATTPERLQRRLAGDLDLIVARAMAYEPDRRYTSVAALADDLRRHLSGWPVSAQKDGWAYRARKFLGRHRVAVSAAALAGLALVAGTAGVWWQANRARAEAVRAEAEAARSRQVTDLVTELFRLSDPTRSPGDSITARQLVEEGLTRVERELEGDPELQATLLTEIAGIYRNLGMLDRAEAIARRVVAIRASTRPGSPAHAAAIADEAAILAERDRPAEAALRYREALALLDTGDSSAPDTLRARIRSGLAWELRTQGDHEAAAALFRQALDVQAAALGPGSADAARTTLGLASALHDGGRFDEAEALFAQALAAGRWHEGPADPAVAASLANLGMLRRLRQDYAGAEAMLEAALDHRRRLYGLDHPETIESMDSWGAELIELGRFEESLAVLTDARERALRTLGPEHATTVSVGEALAYARHMWGDFEASLALRDSMIAIKKRVRGVDHAGIVYSLVQQARTARVGGRVERASVALDSAWAMADRLGGEDGVYRGLMRQERGHLAVAAGDRVAADVHFREAARILGTTLREDHRYRVELDLDRTVHALRGGAEPGGIAERLAVIDSLFRTHRTSPHPTLGRVALALGETRLVAGDREEAARAFRRARTELVRLPQRHWLRGFAGAGLALAEGDRAGAEEGLRTVERQLSPSAPETRRLRELVGGVSHPPGR